MAEGQRRGGVLRQRVSAQVERRLEGAAAGGADGGLRLMDESHVLAQVGGVGVAAAAAPAPHARRAARCTTHTLQPRRRPKPLDTP